METFMRVMTLVANVAVGVTATALFVAFLWWASYVQEPAATTAKFEITKEVIRGGEKN